MGRILTHPVCELTQFSELGRMAMGPADET